MAINMEIVQNADTDSIIRFRAENRTNILVIGVGGGGGNAINRMMETGLAGVSFAIANTDQQVLFESDAGNRIVLGKKITGGRGAGGNPELGRSAAEEDLDELKELLDGVHMVFITAGMGGGTGTGAAPVLAQLAREMGILTVGVVTFPFLFEGMNKKKIAEKGIEELRKSVDTLIVIPNQMLLKIIDGKTPIKESFRVADDVLRMGVKGISDLITIPGEINVDFNDVRAVISNSGDALMGIGVGKGENRAIDAVTQAINNPLLGGEEIKNARGVLLQITGDPTFSLSEYSEIMEKVSEHIDSSEESQITSGMVIDEELQNEVKVTLIVTGFTRKEEKPERTKRVLSEDKETVSLRNLRNTLNVDSLLPDSELSPAVDDDNDYYVPTILRQRR